MAPKQLWTHSASSIPVAANEVGDIRAVWFTDNFTGARNHNRRTKQQGPKRVYECELKPEAVVLKANIPLSQQPVIQKN